MPWRKKNKTDKSPLKLLLWTAFAGLVFGFLGMGEIAEDLLRASRNSLHWHKASGDIVLVKIDDRSLRDVGRWPWRRSEQAKLVEELTRAGANRIFFDVSFHGPSIAQDDRRFAEALKRSGRAVLAVKARSGPDAGARQDAPPLPMFARHAQLGTISVQYNYQNAVWRIPYAVDFNEKAIPSFAAQLANVSGSTDQLFTPDYSVDPTTIPNISASQVLDGSASAAMLRGKDIVIGITTDAAGDQYFIPGTGKMGGAYVQIIGAETLKAGTPRHLGWLPLFAIALALVAWVVVERKPGRQVAILSTAAALVLMLPVLSEAHLLYLDVTPGLFVLLTIATVLGWRAYRQRGLVDAISGLPNLNALRDNKAGHDQAIIVARVLNYAEIVAALPQNRERQVVEQIVARLKLGSSARVLYQGDGGIFAWFEDSRVPFGNQMEALHALFRNPARVDTQPIDLSITFGVEIGSNRSLSNRLASSVVAAEEAAHDGLKWKFHDPESLHDASWRLSMLSQLDDAVEKGEIWVAYQPKLELKTRRIIGAEALARWTHPQKGPIAASEFIAAAEQHDRIGRLTDFVLEQAIAAAAAANRKQAGFGMAVNLSARLLDDRGFVLRLTAMLARHGLPANLLTLELTETAALANNGTAFEVLTAIRDLGVTISIDDYGTGLSTLEYLKKIPASEIKIDQSFVRGMLDNRSDLVMVQSTITLAHSLGRKVVAEGVERRDVLDALVDMGCDVAQGYVIGRPTSIDSIVKRLSAPPKATRGV